MGMGIYTPIDENGRLDLFFSSCTYSSFSYLVIELGLVAEVILSCSSEHYPQPKSAGCPTSGQNISIKSG